MKGFSENKLVIAEFIESNRGINMWNFFLH